MCLFHVDEVDLTLGLVIVTDILIILIVDGEVLLIQEVGLALVSESANLTLHGLNTLRVHLFLKLTVLKL